MRQGDLDVTQYFNAMTKLWQELDLSTNSNWCCPEGGIQYKKLLDKERVHDFLAGLNRELNEKNYDSKGIQVAKTATSSSGEATACDAQGNSTTSLNLNKEQMEQLYELLIPTKPDISLLAQKGFDFGEEDWQS
ncbi:hypothetical protein CK203_083381 [Vitis vinifera]|uniref:Retrotransposon gag domain-containing protein n=1 Tax=Vitis vinifera TaxID=29760 RepID=A0A438BWB8_VITVI|nr:hypothetical protein CK203_083381 [Vitis vinifera]